MSKYESRWQNAVSIATQINEKLKQGYIILDEDRLPVLPFIITESEVKNGSGNVFTIWFAKDIDLDMGMHTSIKEYNAQFKEWVAVHPNHFEPIFLLT